MMTQDEITSLFAPHILERRADLKKGKRLVHYTSAEAAFQIISGREMWLRNAQMMNDFSEIQHGINCLSQAWNSDAGKRLQAMLDRLKDGLTDEITQLFDGHAHNFRYETYITCLSEHEDHEDYLGRLSMWRAYGNRAGVALILNNTAFAAETDEMKVFSSPVMYQDVPMFVEWFQAWADTIVAAEDRVRSVGADAVLNTIFWIFRSFALCTKHPGFAEEREWRVFYSPVVEGDSDWIIPAVEVVSGVPQHLMKLQLRDDLTKGIVGVSPNTLINRIIIGPCENPLQVRNAIASAVAGLGIADPIDKMWMSLIPLRDR